MARAGTIRTSTAASLCRVLAVALAATLCAGAPAQAGTAASTNTATTTACGIQPYGLIGARWTELGGANSALGCPRTSEVDVYLDGVWAGRRQNFLRGQMVWSPRQGPKLVVSAWSIGGYAYVDWRTTAPRSYDRFLVRWTSAADRGGTQRDIGGGTGGRMRVRVVTSSGYRFIVEGCDNGTFSSSCKQGWTLSVTA
ncbi:LGFP repeat-containing protein [Nonomuraea sp. LPB2021202275-12-8]|uniref:LGFP repeat-containing protein n=1 Tax=Nonomuraea sp. LPB2021202275-12-8 TaxID=3120159 RepID=UPI00300D9DBF